LLRETPKLQQSFLRSLQIRQAAAAEIIPRFVLSELSAADDASRFNSNEDDRPLSRCAWADIYYHHRRQNDQSHAKALRTWFTGELFGLF
jgi:hypothetical protein